ncbi:MAG: HDOD domain-containing protein [Candidatus Cloacimonetes bacterium]|nr:HDOD domain-containing protein [Candidatus Cloacimonadota bacterium]
MKQSPPTLEKIVHSVTQLASLPALHMRILEVLNQSDADLVELDTLISRDPSLTARLLRRSNSSYFGRGGTVSTVRHALTVLGLDHARDIVLSASVLSVFEKLPQSLISMKGFWEHSVLVGLLAREIGILNQLDNAEELNTAGLLHDVGRLVMIQTLPVEYHKLLLYAKAAGKPLVLVEHQHLGYTHGQVGGALFSEWGLPFSICQAAAHHHLPSAIQSNRELVEIVQLADVLAHGLQIGNSGAFHVPPFDPDTALRLLPPDSIKQVLLTAETAVEDIMVALFAE